MRRFLCCVRAAAALCFFAKAKEKEHDEFGSLQGAWEWQRPRGRDGVLMLIHGCRLFLMPYVDGEPINLQALSAPPPRAGGQDSCTLGKQGARRFLAGPHLTGGER